MKRSLTSRLILVAMIVALGLALSFALDNERSLALSTLPEGVHSTMGQNETFLYARNAENDALYLSQDGRSWRELPVSFTGSVRDVASADAASDVVYVATDDALYVTVNGGASWHLSEAVPAPVLALTAEPGMDDMLYVVTEGGALFKVTDGGQSAMPVQGEGLPSTVRELVVSRIDTDTLFAATDGGLFRSDDAGTSWHQVPGIPATTDLLLMSDNPSWLFAATRDGGLFRSTDGGATWEPTNEGLGLYPGTTLAVTALAQRPEQPDTIYAATAYVTGHTERHLSPGAIMMSPDRGTQWIPVASLPSSSPIVTALVPEQGAGQGVRAVTESGMTLYQLDADRALEMLQSDEYETQVQGAKVLSVAAVPTQGEALLPYLYEEDGQLGYYVARALGHAGGEEITQELSAIVQSDANSIVKLRALLALEMIADPATTGVLTAAFEQDALSRSAAEALGAIGTEEAWAPLLAALADEELTAQRQAAMATFEANAEAAAEPLILQLGSDNPTVRANAAEALAWMGQDDAILPLRALLEDTDATVRANAAFALGELRDQGSVTRLETMSLEDESANVRDIAGYAVTRAQRVEAEPVTAIQQPTDGAPGLLERLQIESIPWMKALILMVTALLSLFVLTARPRPAETE